MPRHALAAIVCASLVTSTMVRDARAGDTDAWFARDKALHFDVSLGIAATSYALATWKLTDSRGAALAIAGGFTLAVGAAKEGLDALGLGDPSWKDFAWDAIGTVCGLAIAWGADLLIGGVSADRPALAAPPQALVRF
jgi:putative lipoprotein